MSLLAQDERLTRRVGAVTLVLIALSIVFFVFVYDQIEWGKHIRLRIYFHTTGGLREGADFVVAGKAVGKIEAITFVPRGTKPKLLGDEEGVAVKVSIDADDAEHIMYGGDVFVTSRGALSGRYLEIGPAPEPGTLLPDGTVAGPLRGLRAGDEIVGRDPPTLDRVLQRTWDNLTTAAKFAADIRPEMNALTAEVDNLRATLDQIAPDVKLRDDVSALIDEARQTKVALGGDAGIDRISAMLDHLDTTVTQARSTITKLRTSANQLSAGLDSLKTKLGTRGAEAIDKVEAAIDRVRAAIDKVDPLLAQVEALQQSFARGDGSLLKLMHDPEFPEDAKELGKILKRQPWKIINRPPK
ncbi:MAG TPA: MlaD family protein [Kofleriaceae bacterium]|nr:MlaD family protein [Kofleriaceae bacterium]